MDNEPIGEVERLEGVEEALITQVRWAEERCDVACKQRDEARADNAALIALLGEPHATECRNPGSHPGAELLARIERLRAVVRAFDGHCKSGKSSDWSRARQAVKALQPGDLGGEA